MRYLWVSLLAHSRLDISANLCASYPHQISFDLMCFTVEKLLSQMQVLPNMLATERAVEVMPLAAVSKTKSPLTALCLKRQIWLQLRVQTPVLMATCWQQQSSDLGIPNMHDMEKLLLWTGLVSAWMCANRTHTVWFLPCNIVLRWLRWRWCLLRRPNRKDTVSLAFP